MSNEERVLRKGDSTVGYPLSPRPDSLYQSVLSIPGVEGPWTDGTLDTGYMRHSVEFGRRWIEEQSGHEWPTLIIPAAMRHSLWPIAMPKNYGRMKVHCPEAGEKFHATTVPMLVAPSVERPLWKVVFTDAIGEEKPKEATKEVDTDGPLVMLCIGGPRDGQFVTTKECEPNPEGYQWFVPNFGDGKDIPFYLHADLKMSEAMHMLRDHYAKTKKAEVLSYQDEFAKATAEATKKAPPQADNTVPPNGQHIAMFPLDTNPHPCGPWDESTSSRHDIEHAMRSAIAWIDSNGGGQPYELIIPAKRMSTVGASDEMRNYMRQHCTPEQTWRGLPRMFYGVTVVIRDDFTAPAVVSPCLSDPSRWQVNLFERFK